MDTNITNLEVKIISDDDAINELLKQMITITLSLDVDLIQETILKGR